MGDKKGEYGKAKILDKYFVDLFTNRANQLIMMSFVPILINFIPKYVDKVSFSITNFT